MNIEHRKEQFLIKLMVRIILAGGRQINPSKLREMKLGFLLDTIYPNMIELSSHTVKQIEYDLDERY